MNRINHSSRFIEMFGGNGASVKWPKAKLTEIVDSECPISYGIVQPDDDVKDGVPIVRPVDLNVGLYVKREGLKCTTPEISNAYKRTVLRGEELLLCVRGTTGLMGIATEELKGANVTRGITPLFFKPGINRIYVLGAFLSDDIQTYIKEHTIGSTLKGINMEKVRKIEIPVPPIALQNKYEQIFKQADKSKFFGFKSRFIEQFGTPHNAEWPLLSFAEFASIDAQMTDDFEAYADSPHIGIDSIEQNTGKILNYRTVSEDSVKSGKYIFTRNHIIYSKIRPNLNKVAEPDFDGLCSADAYPLLAKEKVCKKRFLAIILRSDDFLSYIVPLSNRTGMPKANREQLEGYSFRMPPVDIQDAFLSIVEQADKSKLLN